MTSSKIKLYLAIGSGLLSLFVFAAGLVAFYLGDTIVGLVNMALFTIVCSMTLWMLVVWDSEDGK